MSSIDLTFCFESKFEITPPSFTIFQNDKIVYDPTTVYKKYTAQVKIKDIDTKIIVKRTNHDQLTDQQLILESLHADGIDLKKVLNHCRYYPTYPEPWHSEQIIQGITWPDYHTGSLVWGWNGDWVFEFTAPFYTWLLQNV